MRRPIIAGNWKMNKTNAEAATLINELKPLVADAEAEVVICVPFTDLRTAVELTRGSNIKVGAENVHFAKSGAYTGEISADMLVELGVEYVVIGHSERRQYFNETDETVNKRALAALEAGLKPIVCVGETLAQREAGQTESVNERQTLGAFEGFTAEMFKNVVVAYEPVWAIGTGKTATDEEANETIGFIRNVVAKKFGQAVADGLRIQYGGSMNPKNAKALMAQKEIDGGLIGGASLKAVDFSHVVKYNA
ncbi:MAG: triose-phosphate isomerase [Clostridia bacterium]